MTMVETLLALAISALILVPLLGFAQLAFQQQTATRERNNAATNSGELRTYFYRDVASAGAAYLTGPELVDCVGGDGAGGTLLLALKAESERIVYTRATGSEGGTSLWRRTCATAGGATTASAEVVDKLTSTGAEMSCKAAGSLPDSCQRINLRITTTDSEQTSLTVSVRDDGSTNVSNPGGTAYTPPTVALTAAPTSVFRGESVAFSAAGSADPGGSALSYYWEFGDGSSSTSQSPTKSYSTKGSFTAILTVTNAAGTPATDFVVVEVKNRLPVAVIAAPEDGRVFSAGQGINFSSSGSNDTADAAYGGSVTSYYWEFGDGTTSTSANPTNKTYSAASPTASGYTVKLTVTDNEGGTNQTQIKVRIQSPPTASITAPANGATIQRGVATTFTASASDSDGTITSYAWDFGDGTTGSGESTTHTYANSVPAGAKTVTLTVTDNDGFAVVRTVNVTITNATPTASITAPANGTNVTRGVAVSFASTASDPDGTIASYSWNFGDGTTSTQQNPTKTYANSVSTGSKTVTLVVTDNDGGTATRTITVNVVNLVPSASITAPADGTDVTRGQAVSFTATASDADGTIASYSWNFGDGTTSTQQNPTKTYANSVTPGTKTVTLTVTDNNGGTVVKTITVDVVNALPTASITAPADGATVARSQAVSFTSTASDVDGTIASYAWNFGDGTTSTQQNPTKTYANSVTTGAKTVTLTVTDNNGATVVKTITVNVGNASPTASITAPANGANVTRGVSVNFTATASDPDGTIAGWAWDFGDGTTSTQQNPTKTYANSVTPGAKTVTLTVTDNSGATAVRTITVNVNNQNPTASITAPANGATVNRGDTVNFAATASDSDGTISTYAWDFGDGNTGAGATPAKIYTALGAKTVTLTVTDNNGGTVVRTITLTVVNNPPTASITAPTNGSNVTRGVPINFTSTASDVDGTISSYAWNFGDGTTSTQQNPTKTYANSVTTGSKTVTLVVTDNDGGTVTRTITVNVVNSAPSVSITAPPTGTDVTRGQAIGFTSSASDPDGTIASYAWNFGDSTTSTQQNPTKTYANSVTPGTKTVTLTVTDNNGTTATTSITVDVANSAPSASITAPANGANVSRNVAVGFTSTASDVDGTISSYSWNFGDGTTSTQQNPTKTYANSVTPGAKTVTLTVTDNNGGTAVRTITVNLGNNAPSASITAPANGANVTRSVAVSFTATASDSDGTIAGYAWDFGDGTTSTSQNPSKTYANSVSTGAKTVTLTVTDNNGGTTVRTITVNVVNSAPSASITAPANNATVYKGDTVNFAATASDVDGTISTYVWDFGDGNTGAGANPSKIYTAFGAKTVTLTVTDSDGGTTVRTITVNVASRPPTVSIAAAPTAGRAPFASTLTPTVADPDGDAIASFQWNYGNGTVVNGSGNPTTVNPTFTHNVSGDTFISAAYTVTLTVTDANGAVGTGTVVVTANGSPAPTSFAKQSTRCVRSFIFCVERGITFTWSAVSNVNAYQIQLDNNTPVTFTGTSGEVTGLSGSSDTYDAKIRSRDATTGKWGPWSSTINVSS
ncbi:PKD domain-containing protein [Dermatobacter hominis]|uniref:PKD domain-containing protein n=1 Tax=Dermatobacter hominis TaxID=2884263 RepID=UPI001D109A1F|nr:PKD domain-containing protein [Dermatobacter hominis]UDY37962.1 PKD domain-containing protein [Dermatobacter hominis]